MKANRYFLFLFLFLFSFSAVYGQGVIVPNASPKTIVWQKSSFAVDSILRIGITKPQKPSWWNDTVPFDGAIVLNPADSQMYWYYNGWKKAGGNTLDTTSLSERIDARVKYMDTAEMLDPYATKKALSDTSSALRTLISLGFADSTKYATQYRLDTVKANRVPYVGATTNVNLGEWQASVGQITLDQTPTQPTGVGVLRWNDVDGTADLRLKGNNVTLQIGQEQLVRVVNKTGADLLESQYHAVYVNGAQGQRLKVADAIATADSTSAATIGVVTENIALNQEGFVTTSGLVNEINTTGGLQGETWSDGDLLYLSGTTVGGITNIKPVAPIHTIIIGYVVYAHAVHGKIFVKVDNGYELEELHNVKITSVANNDGLFYESATSLWKNKSIATVLGYTPANNASVVKYTDTAAMLLPYLRKLDTASLSSRIDAKGSGTVTSIATSTGTGITGGPITTTGTLAIDTTLISTRLWRQKAVDSINAQLALKVKYTDTATLVAPYLRKVDTTAMLLPYLRKVDTITMLSPYTRLAGTLTTNYVTKATSGNTIETGLLYDNGSNVMLGTTTSAGDKFTISGTTATQPISTITTTSNTSSIQPIFRLTTAGITNQTRVLSFLTPSRADWGFTMGAETTPNLYVGGSGGNWFWRANYNTSGVASNTFKIANDLDATQLGLTTLNLSQGNGQTGNLFAATSYGGVMGDLVNIDGGGRLGIGGTANASAALDINSTTKGLGLPSMTTTQQNAIATPKEGLMLFNNSLGYPTYYSGSSWNSFGTGTVTSIATNNGTGITGGTITTSGTLAIDTTLISTRLWRQKGIDSINTQLALKANYTDTASMLLPYLRDADTTAMLTPYARKQSPTIITPSITGLSSGTTNDSLIVADATTGALKRISSSRISSGGGGGGTPIYKLASQTLTAAGWSASGGYYQYTFSSAYITTSSFIIFTPNNASVNEVSTAMMLPQIDVTTGSCTFYTSFPPQNNIVGDIVIFTTL